MRTLRVRCQSLGEAAESEAGILLPVATIADYTTGVLLTLLGSEGVFKLGFGGNLLVRMRCIVVQTSYGVSCLRTRQGYTLTCLTRHTLIFLLTTGDGCYSKHAVEATIARGSSRTEGSRTTTCITLSTTGWLFYVLAFTSLEARGRMRITVRFFRTLATLLIVLSAEITTRGAIFAVTVAKDRMYSGLDSHT